MKKINQEKLKEILPLTEKLKMKLLERYKSEYTQFLANKEAERVREAEKAKEALKNKVSNLHTLTLNGPFTIHIVPTTKCV